MVVFLADRPHRWTIRPFAMKDHRKISGKIVSGVNQGTFFTQLDWIQEQCLEKLGFKPFP